MVLNSEIRTQCRLAEKLELIASVIDSSRFGQRLREPSFLLSFVSLNMAEIILLLPQGQGSSLKM